MKPLHLHVLLVSCNQLAMSGSRMTVMLYAAYLQASPVVIGLLAGLFGLVSAFVAVPVGRWIDRMGPRKPLLLASVMVTIGGIIAGLQEDLAVLFLACPLIGTFNSMFQMTSDQTVGRFGEPKDRPANFALQALGMSAATLAGPLVAGLAIDHLWHSSAFLLLAAIASIPLIVIGLGLLDFPQAPQRGRTEGFDAAPGWTLLRQQRLRRPYIVATMSNAVWSVVNFMIPLYGAQIGISATRIGTLMACMCGGVVGTRALMQPLVRRFKPWPLVVLAQVLIGIGFFGIPFTAEYAALVSLVIIMGLGLGLTGPLSTSLMYDASPPDRVAEVVGMRMTIANIAQAVVPLLFGAIGSVFGVGPVFWTVAAIVLGDAWSNRSEIGKKGRGSGLT